MILPIRVECQRRRISRICHFSPSRNLSHIFAGKTGVMATEKLETAEQLIFNPTDCDRFDGWRSHVCCSIEYPNLWYFSKAKDRESLFRDWIILFIKPDYLWADGTFFCPRNAAASCGSQATAGLVGFRALFADEIHGAYGRTYTRLPRLLDCCPTDEQAEVLVKDQIALEDIQGIAVASEEQAKNEAARLRFSGFKNMSVPFIVAPELFGPARSLSQKLHAGERPMESKFRF
jgi:hypothetical protein